MKCERRDEMKDIETIDTFNQITVDINGDVGSPLGYMAGGFHAGLRRKKKTLDGFTLRQKRLQQVYIRLIVLKQHHLK